VRFIADGVNIPDELLWAQDEGQVVFFCGAGVSQARARLPNFNGLTQRVLDELGATDHDDARRLHKIANISRDAHGVGLAISDQVFQLLRRRFTDANIGAKVAECLRPKEGVDLSAHRTLLTLSKLRTGKTRIVTTNFDLLFEQCNSRLKSVTRSNLPRLAFNEADWGVVHLHGCVKRDYSGPTEDGFVLSSAEFGDAYLAMGWARDFVREILQRYIAVFIGYSADDPPIRYLLEGLQLSKKQNNRAFAFQSDSGGAATDSWSEKGVEALIYPTEEGCGHRRLWDTLDEWAKRTADPGKWRARALKKSQKSPSALAPHERGMIAHIVNSATGAQAFYQHEPRMAAEWLCVFDPLIRFGEPRSENGRHDGATIDPHDRYRLDSDPPPRIESRKYGLYGRVPENAWSAFLPNATDLRTLGPHETSNIRGSFARTAPYLPNRMRMLASWIAASAQQPAAAWWAGQQVSLHRQILGQIRLLPEVAGKGHRSAVADAWCTILEYHDLQATDHDEEIESQHWNGRTDWNESQVRAYAKYFSPRLKVGGIWRRPVPPVAGSRLKASDLVSVDVDYSEGIEAIDIPDECLRSLLPKLRAALELAEYLEGRYSYNIDFCSIEPDDNEQADDEFGSSYSRHYHLSGRVLVFVGVLKRLAILDPDAARAEVEAWRRQSKIFDRLRIWALGNLDIAPADCLAAELLVVSDEGFWPFRGERDLLLGLARKWSEVALHNRVALEKRILKGPSRHRQVTASDFAERSARRRLSRINWMSLRGCEFTFDLDATNVRLQAMTPHWKPEYAERAADSLDGRSGWVRTETDFSAIENLPAQDVIPFVEGLERRPDREFISYDPFQGLSKEHPKKALAALVASNRRQPFPARLWETFLRVDIRKDDATELSSAIAGEILKISDADFILIARTASDWFEKIGPALLLGAKNLFDTLWDKFIRAMQTNETARRSSLVREGRTPDWATESINSAPGNLAELATSINLDPLPGYREKFPQDWLARIEQLLALPNDSRCYALVIFGHRLNWLFHVDPDWTRTHILSALERNGPDLDQDAIWAGFFWHATTPPRELYVSIKPHLLRMCRQRSEQLVRYAEIQAGMLLAGWGTKDNDTGERLVSNAEMQALILDAGDEFRQHTIWLLRRWAAEEDSGWASQVGEFLRDAWPKHKDIRTAKISAILCGLALSQKSNFPEIAGIVSQLIAKVGDDRMFIQGLHKVNEKLAMQYPVALLGLLYSMLPDNAMRWPYGAETTVRALGQSHPAIRSDIRFIELEGRLL
jgi:hypothetical protein